MPKARNPLAALRRKSSSPFSSAPRTKPGSRSGSNLAEKADNDRFEDVGGVVSFAPPKTPQDVISLLKYAQKSAFDELPDRAPGMSSERVSEVLRYQKCLPPVVTVAHLHALSESSTNTERELARLIAGGQIRKVIVYGRGKGGQGVGEGIVLVKDWKDCFSNSDVDLSLREKYFSLMDSHPTSQSTSTASLTHEEVRQLVQAGFLTSKSILSNATNLSGYATVSFGIASAGSRATTGTLAAVGGHGAIHESGGGGSTLATKENRTLTSMHLKSNEMTFSLPNTGPYLKLLTEARHHLLFLLKQMSPRHREATLDLLKEKWEGNIANDPASKAKRMRGEWNGKLPGQTRKWRDFYGLQFEWVLEECIGAGLVEVFNTGSVGLAARAR
ncbi:hypothetical protein K431DRAFT_233744 [Polychaeton citri CBS 116435]|uniref:Serine-threonine protein kinase 19 n=1 Tax=Polychaeton citri CBS 116435 TaxID=1314669 RepID=A0A9P4Q2I0_9PEZI|nr:hypothetical protein K431DRAFT_233744 [Polychaeton citri CBS 116435]